MTKITKDERLDIIERKNKGETLTSIAKHYSVTITAISYIVNLKTSNKKTLGIKSKYSSSEQFSDYMREYMREYNAEKRMAALNILGGKCVKCGFSDPRALQIDHINGGGHSERKKIRSTTIYSKIISNYNVEKYKYQLLCANCNWIKRYENNESGSDVIHFSY